VAFPALSSIERDRLAVVLAAGARDDRGSIRLSVGVAELKVDYLERSGRGQLFGS
jgi:hypothetical protein